MEREIQVGKVFLKLNNLVEYEIEQLKPSIGRLYFQEGESVLPYGEEVRDLYYLAKGQVKVTNINNFGQEKTFSYVNAGFFICDAVFFTKATNFSTVIAMSPCEVWRFGHDYVMNELLVKHPEVAIYIIKTMSTKMLGVYAHMKDLSMKNPQKAIAHFIVSLVETQGIQKANGSWSVAMRITHQQMADLLGLHRVTVTSTLNEFKKQGILQKKTQQFDIYRLADLRNLLEEE